MKSLSFSNGAHQESSVPRPKNLQVNHTLHLLEHRKENGGFRGVSSEPNVPLSKPQMINEGFILPTAKVKEAGHLFFLSLSILLFPSSFFYLSLSLEIFFFSFGLSFCKQTEYLGFPGSVVARSLRRCHSHPSLFEGRSRL